MMKSCSRPFDLRSRVESDASHEGGRRSRAMNTAAALKYHPGLASSSDLRTDQRAGSLVSADVHAITTLIHAISEDFSLEPVIDTVVSLAMEHAGADRGSWRCRGGARSRSSLKGRGPGM